MFTDDTQLFNNNYNSVQKKMMFYLYMERPLVQRSIMKRQKVCIFDR
jgi:hypothetical protein